MLAPNTSLILKRRQREEREKLWRGEKERRRRMVFTATEDLFTNGLLLVSYSLFLPPSPPSLHPL